MVASWRAILQYNLVADADFGNLDSSYWEYYVTLILVPCFFALAFVEESYICVLLEPFLQVLPFPIELFFSPGELYSKFDISCGKTRKASCFLSPAPLRSLVGLREGA